MIKRPSPANTAPPTQPGHLLPALPDDLVAPGKWIQSLPPAFIATLMSATVIRNYSAGEVLFNKGEPGEGLYFIEAGEVRSSTVNEEGQELLLYLFEPGSCVGLASALDGAPSPSTCRAFCDTRLRLLPRNQLLQILKDEPNYYRHIVDLLLLWMRGLISGLEDQAPLSVRARLAKRLLQLAHVYGESRAEGIVIPFRFPQEELALMLGATRQSIHQQLADFRDRGLISLSRGMFTIHDTAALTACGNGKGSR